VSTIVPPSASRQANCYFLFVYKPAMLWRGLSPILLEAPRPIAIRLVKCMLLASSQSVMISHPSPQKLDAEKSKENQLPLQEAISKIGGGSLQRRSIRLANIIPTTCTSLVSSSLMVWIIPPTTCHLDRTFTSIVVRLENALLRLSTLTAWWATLGGGYFFCRRISYSLQLARQQRAAALLLGNVGMARQCSINEAYNLLYGGRFHEARTVLLKLWKSCPDEDTVTQNQCRAAWILGKRLKKTARKLERYHHSDDRHLAMNSKKQTVDLVDDYQRIRLVAG
jgi:hypothetical protein